MADGRMMRSASTKPWQYRALRINALLAFRQSLVFGLGGVAVALPFGDPAPTWAFVGPALVGAGRAMPTSVRVQNGMVTIRNPLRRHRLPARSVASIEATAWVSGRGRLVRLRTNDGRRIRVAGLAGDNSGLADTLRLIIRDGL
jgi:hypothetical protein